MPVSVVVAVVSCVVVALTVWLWSVVTWLAWLESVSVAVDWYLPL